MNMQVNRLTAEDYAQRFAQPMSRKLQETQGKPASTARAEQAERTEQTARAGQSFLREHPAPDPKEGVVMNLSAEGVRKMEAAEGSVRKVENGKETKPAAQQEKKARDTVEAVMERREEKKTEEADKKAEETRKAAVGAQPATSRDAIKAEQARRTERKEEEATIEANPAMQPKTSREAIDEELKQHTQGKETEKPAVANPADQPKTSREAIEAAGEKAGAEQNTPQTIDLGVRNATMSLDRMRDEMQQRQAQQAVNPLAAA